MRMQSSLARRQSAALPNGFWRIVMLMVLAGALVYGAGAVLGSDVGIRSAPFLIGTVVSGSGTLLAVVGLLELLVGSANKRRRP